MTTAKKAGSAADAFETGAAINADALKEGYDKFTKGMSEFADFQKNSVEALLASTGALAKGVEKAAAEQTEFLKASYEDGVAALTAASTAKSAQDAIEVQSDYLRATFEKNLGHFNKLADHWISTGKQAAEPLKARYGELVEIVQSYRP